MTRRMDERPVRGAQTWSYHRAHPQAGWWKCFRSYCDTNLKCSTVLSALSTLTLRSVGWANSYPPQRCTSITFVSSNVRTISPSWWVTHCEWTLSSPPLHPLLIPHKLPYRKTIQTSQHFPSHDVSSTPPLPFLPHHSLFLILSSYSSPRFYPFYYSCLGKLFVLCLEFVWIARGQHEVL